MALIALVFVLGIVSGIAATIAALVAYILWTARDLPDNIEPSAKE
ncbi:hypothetical protein [Tsukamurella paurometabola]|uniref:Uncharacterized protein n=1 Tax=Tsukamurella paurometabola TaxID=2061 RepID=A0A3P8MEH2_TSUPA|nr:hypothetical protein [Tsukamurella paurometabola]VDR40193.1 Uncharacterised protein [Tsukamurella paurometabola]